LRERSEENQLEMELAVVVVVTGGVGGVGGAGWSDAVTSSLRNISIAMWLVNGGHFSPS
jgi:hypothetical protein